MDFGALFLYMLVAAFTPGPNNLTMFYLSANYGVRNVNKFVIASMGCVCLKTFLCGLLNMALADIMPSVVSWLKWFGAAYMLWLAYKMIKNGFSKDEDMSGHKAEEASYRTGVILQILNAKSWVGGMTYFAVYVPSDQYSLSIVILITLMATAILTTATYAWGFFGGAIKRIYAQHKKVFGIIMGLSLIYCAVTALL